MDRSAAKNSQLTSALVRGAEREAGATAGTAARGWTEESAAAGPKLVRGGHYEFDLRRGASQVVRVPHQLSAYDGLEELMAIQRETAHRIALLSKSNDELAEYLLTPDGKADVEAKEAVAENKVVLAGYVKTQGEITAMLAMIGHDKPLHAVFVEEAQWDPADPLEGGGPQPPPAAADRPGMSL
jgi:hypothetical protein